MFLYDFFLLALFFWVSRTKRRGYTYKFYYFSLFRWKYENRTCMWVWDRLTSRIEWLLKNVCWVWIYLQLYAVLEVMYGQTEKAQLLNVFKFKRGSNLLAMWSNKDDQQKVKHFAFIFCIYIHTHMIIKLITKSTFIYN